MNNSQIRTLMCVLCLAFCAIMAGCESPATSEKTTAVAEKPCETKKAATLGPYDLAADWMDEAGFVDQWLIVGPLPNPGERPDNEGFNTDYLKNDGGELNYVPSNGMELKAPDGSVLKWQQYSAATTDISFFDIEYLKLEPTQEDILCYCACWIESDADKQVELRIGSDDGYKLWLNHELIAEENVYRAMEMDQETYEIKLNKGKNLILLKLCQDWGEYEFTLRLVDSEGNEVPGLKAWN